MRCPEGCMKQIHTAMFRVTNGHPPLKSSKWKAFLIWTGNTYILHLYHYHHLVLKYDMFSHVILFEWWEKKADKRGLDSAKIWLEARRTRFDYLKEEGT